MIDILITLFRRFAIRIDASFLITFVERRGKTIEHDSRPRVTHRPADLDWTSTDTSLEELERAIEREAKGW